MEWYLCRRQEVEEVAGVQEAATTIGLHGCLSTPKQEETPLSLFTCTAALPCHRGFHTTSRISQIDRQPDQ